MLSSLPTVIIGAGPTGLAAAAHLHEYDERFLILEKGSHAGSNIQEWSHVQLFSPWEYNIDRAAKRLLQETEWEEPVSDQLPTGGELVKEYLEPFAALPSIRTNIVYHAEVKAITKKNIDKVKSDSREAAAFILFVNINGSIKKIEAKAIIDATGTWNSPNPPFADGVWRTEELINKLHVNIPNIKEEADRFKNKHIAVIGSGHSALNSLIELTDLKAAFPDTKISWIIRKQHISETFGGEENDELAARGSLGSKAHQLVDNGLLHIHSGFYVDEIKEQDNSFVIQSSDGISINGIDEVIVNTGARPDFSFLKELRLDIDPTVESTKELAPLIDPNLHSCGTVRPHGEKELRHPEAGFYIAGVKSYGRAPTFLMATGYEQVRSITAYIAGNMEESAKIKLKLPQTGVCKAREVPKQLQIIEVNAGDSCGKTSCCC
ncbi:NAD(P)-binding domain-containing protein [Oceanobacillus massiliensis]|uniref:NAD(P)-binding domain-containing protein n=1 Tax=Oceanobacillus massiliensis TaxID=1465765 RepID=UPI000288DDDA|nr:NAD(P)-binding domain-containing protein [Oceanobacillus massiliensis]